LRIPQDSWKRLAGVDLFVWDATGSAPEPVALARTRAAELRAYIVVLHPERCFAVDPDGTVVAGTFGAYQLAAFAYDRTRSSATVVAPHTDVLRGLEMIRDLRSVARKDVDLAERV